MRARKSVKSTLNFAIHHIYALDFIETNIDESSSMNQEPQIRFFIACPRSGSTLLMRIFAEFPVCAVTSRLILMGNAGSGESFSPNYSILNNPYHHSVFISAVKSGKRLLVCKEELGNNSQKGECLYDVCPSPSTYALVWPFFLIRDPIRVFDSWKNVGWTDAQSLIDCYTNIFRMLHQAPSHAVSCLVYERLIRKPQTEVQASVHGGECHLRRQCFTSSNHSDLRSSSRPNVRELSTVKRNHLVCSRLWRLAHLLK